MLQAAYGWTDSHLHKLLVGGLTIGAPELLEGDFDGPKTLEASEICLKDLTFPYEKDPTLSLTYVYDFGDDWHHELVLRRVPRESGVKYSRCTAGSRSGPPEDVGGGGGYEEFLKAWRDPAHESHKDMRRWVGRKFDPARFDLDATNKAITRALRASKGGYRFRLISEDD